MTRHDRNLREIDIAGQRYLAPPPTPRANGQYVPRPELEEQIIPLLTSKNPRSVLLYGPPGTGKSWLAARVAEVLGLPFYHWQFDARHQAEDMLVTPSIRSDQQIEYILSPIAAAAAAQIGPAVAFADDIDKCAHPGTLSALIPILDPRPSITLKLGCREMALHPGSRFLWACNDRRSLPAYFGDRPIPIEVPIPSLETTLAMVRASECIPEEHVVLELFVAAWKRRALGRNPTPREAINSITWMKAIDDATPGKLQDQRGRQDQIVHAIADEELTR